MLFDGAALNSAPDGQIWSALRQCGNTQVRWLAEQLLSWLSGSPNDHPSLEAASGAAQALLDTLAPPPAPRQPNTWPPQPAMGKGRPPSAWSAPAPQQAAPSTSGGVQTSQPTPPPETGRATQSWPGTALRPAAAPPQHKAASPTRGPMPKWLKVTVIVLIALVVIGVLF